MRLTKAIRENIIRQTMATVPEKDYLSEALDIIQKVLVDEMPDSIKEAYLDGNTDYLAQINCTVKIGNDSHIISNTYNDKVLYGPRNLVRKSYEGFVIRIDDVAFKQLNTDSAAYKAAKALRDSKVMENHINQKHKLKDIRKRLKATVYSVTTINRLKEVLEPELHYLIPEPKDEVKAMLPIEAGPVVDDLKSLGFKPS